MNAWARSQSAFSSGRYERFESATYFDAGLRVELAVDAPHAGLVDPGSYAGGRFLAGEPICAVFGGDRVGFALHGFFEFFGCAVPGDERESPGSLGEQVAVLGFQTAVGAGDSIEVFGRNVTVGKTVTEFGHPRHRLSPFHHGRRRFLAGT
jgi:hypothetical protein